MPHAAAPGGRRQCDVPTVIGMAKGPASFAAIYGRSDRAAAWRQRQQNELSVFRGSWGLNTTH